MTDKKSPQNNPDIDPDKFHEMVAECAYLKAEARGFTPSYETEDWLEAEREISTQAHNESQQV